MRCADCKHYEAEAFGQTVIGRCALIRALASVEEAEISGNDDDARLEVKPDFGCVLFETQQ